MDILTIGDYKVTNDDRIKLPQGYVSDWSLLINSINEDDAGEYICQVNTEPQIISKIYVNVQRKNFKINLKKKDNFFLSSTKNN